jgi:hypothetical protein
VVEDVHQIIQNLKTLVIALEDDRESDAGAARDEGGRGDGAAIEKTGAVAI